MKRSHSELYLHSLQLSFGEYSSRNHQVISKPEYETDRSLRVCLTYVTGSFCPRSGSGKFLYGSWLSWIDSDTPPCSDSTRSGKSFRHCRKRSWAPSRIVFACIDLEKSFEVVQPVPA